jgi:aconitate decarboxylase
VPTDYTSRVAEFCSGLRLDSIPDAVLRHAALALTDVTGCALYGSTLPWSKTLVAAVRGFAPPGPATVIGSDFRLPPDTAALVNGAMVHSFEYDDLHMESFVHPGSSGVPALLAVVDHAAGPIAGADFVAALVTSYEIDIRVGLCAGISLLRGGWHNSAVVGPVGAAAGVARLMGLSPAMTNQCLGTAATQAGGLVSAQYGAMVKRLHPGRAAQSGFYAGALVAAGFTGIEDVFDQEYGGYPATLTDDYDLDELTDGLGTDWRLLDTGFKLFPASASCYTAIEASLWAHQQGVRADDVETITVYCSSAAEDHVGWPYTPSTSTTAQMNLRYCGAAALLDGILDPGRFEGARIADADVVDLTGRYVVHADADITKGGRERRHAIRAEFRLRDGRTLVTEIERAQGFGGAPVTDGEIEAKFMRNTAHVGGRAGEIYAMTRDVLELPDMRTLSQALAG